MTAPVPETAMVLAAGLGKRMRPITDTMPKPLVVVAGKPLIDHALDALVAAGVRRAVVNVHYMSRQIIDHLRARSAPEIVVSDETDALLESGGGLVKALPKLGEAPFLVLNADTFWLDRSGPNLARLAEGWNDAAMDMLLMLADPAEATGHGTGTDFLRNADGRLARAGGSPHGLIYAGAAIVHPRCLAGVAAEPHSLNRHFDRLIAAGRLHGLAMDGHWITVGTPKAIAEAEAAVAAFTARPDVGKG